MFIPRRLRLPAPVRRGSSQRGVTLIEAMVAMLLLLVITIGVLPMFTRSMAQNAAGSEATQAANHVRGHLDEMQQLPFNNLPLQIISGSDRVNNADFFAGNMTTQGDEQWAAPGAGTGPVLWSGDTTVRQYHLGRATDSDADGVDDTFEGLEDADNDGLFDSPLAAGTDPSQIEIKELDVLLTHEREVGGALETPRPYRVRLLKGV